MPDAREAVPGSFRDPHGYVFRREGVLYRQLEPEGAVDYDHFEGIDTFLVPRADYEDALTRAGDVNVVPVDDLDDALNALADLGGNADDLPQVGAEDTNGRR